jgi:hypothetical protein
MQRPQKITFGEMRDRGVLPMRTHGLITLGCLILSRVSYIQRAAGAEPTSGPIFTGISRACSRGAMDGTR